MARAETNRLYTNFSKGLVTEVTALAYPENASIDEDNCDILNNGERVRRYGFNSVENSTDFEVVSLGVTSDVRSAYTHLWKTVANDVDLDFQVIYTNGVVYFYEVTGISNELPLYVKKAFTIDLSAYKLSTATAADVDGNFVSFASGKGELFIANKYIDPLRIVYDPVGDTITVNVITIKVRDHYGLDDDLAVDAEPTTLSAAHHYNLLNQGWGYSGGGTVSGGGGPGQNVSGFGIRDDIVNYVFPTWETDLVTPYLSGPISQYFVAKSRYPSNAKVWWAGKDADGDFQPNLLEKTYFGNTRAPRGHFVIDAFLKNRGAVSGISGLTDESSDTRPDAICFASGRVFYGHESTVYMSAVLEVTDRAGQCYQEADPTSEDISDLIPSDGGFIEIPDADHILKLVPLADGIVVIARNGVWFINSGGQGFTAVDYSVNRVSEFGCQARESVVVAGSTMFWWTKVGIMAIEPATGQFGMIPGQFTSQNITDLTIKTFYNAINEFTRTECKGAYDPATNCIYWVYRVDNTYKRRVLKYSLKFGAFVPYTINCPGAYIAAIMVTEYYNKSLREDSFLSFVTIEKRWRNDLQVYRDWLSLYNFTDSTYIDGSYVNTNYKSTAEFATDISATYSSYIETGYEVLQDGLRKKQIPFLGVFFNRQQTNSCFMYVKWSWANNANSNKWHGPIQAYRPRNADYLTPTQNSDNEDYYDVIYTRNKIRGSGRSIQFRFYEDRQNYGFRILGWHAFYQGNTVP